MDGWSVVATLGESTGHVRSIRLKCSPVRYPFDVMTLTGTGGDYDGLGRSDKEESDG